MGNVIFENGVNRNKRGTGSWSRINQSHSDSFQKDFDIRFGCRAHSRATMVTLVPPGIGAGKFVDFVSQGVSLPANHRPLKIPQKVLFIPFHQRSETVEPYVGSDSSAGILGTVDKPWLSAGIGRFRFVRFESLLVCVRNFSGQQSLLAQARNPG